MARLTKKVKRAIVELRALESTPSDIARELGVPLVDVACVLADERELDALDAAYAERPLGFQGAISIPRARPPNLGPRPPAGTDAYDRWVEDVLASEGAR